MNASVYRNTRFEIRLIQQGPNSFGVICAFRDGTGNAPPLEVPEEEFTDEEMTQIHDVLGMIEEKFAIVYDKYVSDPKNLLKELEKAELTHQAEIERIKNEAAAEKRELEAKLAQAHRSGLITLR